MVALARATRLIASIAVALPLTSGVVTKPAGQLLEKTAAPQQHQLGETVWSANVQPQPRIALVESREHVVEEANTIQMEIGQIADILAHVAVEESNSVTQEQQQLQRLEKRSSVLDTDAEDSDGVTGAVSLLAAGASIQHERSAAPVPAPAPTLSSIAGERMLALQSLLSDATYEEVMPAFEGVPAAFSRLRSGDEPVTDDDVDSNTVAIVCVSTAVWASLVMITAFFYKRSKLFPPEQLADDHVVVDGLWNFHLLSCKEEPSLCCFTCFCAGIRWADNMRMANFYNFWVALFVFTLFMCLGAVGLGLFNLILLCILVHSRQKIRRMFAIPNGTCKTLCVDCFTFCFCAVCAIVQEARQLEEAYQMPGRHHAINFALAGNV